MKINPQASKMHDQICLHKTTNFGIEKRVGVFIDGWHFFITTKFVLKQRVRLQEVLNFCRQRGVIEKAYYFIGEEPESKSQSFLFNARKSGFEVITKPIKRHKNSQILELEILLDKGTTIVGKFHYEGKKPYNSFMYSLKDALVSLFRARGHKVCERDFKECTKSANFDVEMAVYAENLAPKMGRMILFSGDGDFIPLLEDLRYKGIHTEVIAPSPSMDPATNKDLIAVADTFTALERIIDQLVF